MIIASPTSTLQYAWRICMLLAIALSPIANGQSSNDPAPASADSQDGPADWPQHFELYQTQFTIYQPQLDSWNGYSTVARAAVAVQDGADKDPTYGTGSPAGTT
jgi:hypothetical protein